jgi:hypothetical protein
MKKLLLLLLAAPSLSFAQNKVEKYCELIVQKKFMSTKVNIEIDMGEEKKFFNFKDSRIKDDIGKAKTFGSTIAALNYMASINWKLVSCLQMPEPNGNVGNQCFFFKREFDPGELEEVK